MAFDFSLFQAVLMDLDGTLCKEDHALPGAVQLISRLTDQKKKIACLSNSVHSPELIGDRLAHLGMPIPHQNIFTAARATVDYVLEHFGSRPRVFNLSTASVEEMLEGKVTWVADEHEPCDAVIVSNPLGKWATVPRMAVAMRLVRRGAVCLGICADRTYPSPRGLEIGSGAMTTMIAYASDAQPIFFGKPQKRFFEHLCTRLDVRPSECVLIGDNLESDIAGAKAVGMKTILSLTGVAQEADLQRLDARLKPDWVVGTLAEL